MFIHTQKNISVTYIYIQYIHYINIFSKTKSQLSQDCFGNKYKPPSAQMHLSDIYVANQISEKEIISFDLLTARLGQRRGRFNQRVTPEKTDWVKPEQDCLGESAQSTSHGTQLHQHTSPITSSV